MRRSVVLAWVILLVLTAQSVRVGAFVDSRLLATLGALAVVLATASVVDWQHALTSPSGGYLAWAFSVALTVGLASIATVGGMFPTAAPLFTGVAALTGIVLPAIRHAFVSTLAGFLLALAAITSSGMDTLEDLVVPVLTLAVVATATAVMGAEVERASRRQALQMQELEDRRQAFERLYAVSTTLAGVDSLRDGLPQLVGTICRYLGAQVGAVFIYREERHALALRNPIWVNGHILETDELEAPIREGGLVVQVYRSGRPHRVDEVSKRPEAFGVVGDLGVDEAMLAPLRVEGIAVGVILVGDPAFGSFREEQLDELESLAAPAALVVSQLQRYESLSEMSRRMQEVAQMKTDFVSVVSHELRTPLTSIIGALDTLARPDLPDGTAADLVDSSRRQAARLRRLIDDLLIVSRIDRQSVPVAPETVKLAPFLEETVETVGLERVSVSVEPADLQVVADPDHLGRVFINLLENAAKYAPGSPVEVVARPVRRRVEVDVIDHGPGIPESERDRIFERFTQLEPSDTRRRGGSGLGLSIVKGLVEAMGGEVEAGETPGGGATFTVRLPRA